MVIGQRIILSPSFVIGSSEVMLSTTLPPQSQWSLNNLLPQCHISLCLKSTETPPRRSIKTLIPSRSLHVITTKRRTQKTIMFSCLAFRSSLPQVSRVSGLLVSRAPAVASKLNCSRITSPDTGWLWQLQQQWSRR